MVETIFLYTGIWLMLIAAGVIGLILFPSAIVIVMSAGTVFALFMIITTAKNRNASGKTICKKKGKRNFFKKPVPSLAEADKMTGYQFEEYCGELLKRYGFKNVIRTPGSGDNGIDLLAEYKGTSIGIQCKCYSSKVGKSAIQEVYTGKKIYGCDRAVVMTNSYFTAAGLDTAEKTGVVLWDRECMEEILESIR